MANFVGADPRKVTGGEVVSYSGIPYEKSPKGSLSSKGLSGVSDSISSAKETSHHHAKQKSVNKEEIEAFLGIYGTIATRTMAEIVVCHQDTLEKHSLTVEGVHPFSFAALILENQELKAHLITIREAWDSERASYMRKGFILAAETAAGRNPWRETLEGFEKKAREHKTAQTLDIGIFLTKIRSKSHQDNIIKFIKKDEFREVLNYILDAKIA